MLSGHKDNNGIKEVLRYVLSPLFGGRGRSRTTGVMVLLGEGRMGRTYMPRDSERHETTGDVGGAYVREG